MLFANIFKGVVIGAANILPGVSGATLALILGIYARLIESINSMFKTPGSSMKLLVPVVVGMASGIVILGSLIDGLLESFPLESRLFVSGLMFGSLPMLYFTATINPITLTELRSEITQNNEAISPKRGKLKKTSTGYFLISALSAIAILITILLSPTPAETIDATFGVGFLLFVFLGGALAAAALLIPGVSGAMVFIMLGLYPVIMNVIGQVREYVFSPTDTELLVSILTVAIPIGIGIVFGTLVCSRFISVLLKKFHKTTYFVIIGLVVGSVFALFEPDAFSVKDSLYGLGPVSATAAVLSLLLGIFTSYNLGKKNRIP